MATPPFAQSIIDFKLLASGITNRLTALASLGITSDDATSMTAYAEELSRLNQQQEDLKAQLKTKTAEISAKMTEARTRQARLNKLIKIALPKTEWLAFGITAKK